MSWCWGVEIEEGSAGLWVPSKEEVHQRLLSWALRSSKENYGLHCSEWRVALGFLSQSRLVYRVTLNSPFAQRIASTHQQSSLHPDARVPWLLSLNLTAPSLMWVWCNLHLGWIFRKAGTRGAFLLVESRSIPSEMWLWNEHSLLSHQCWLCCHRRC